MIRRQLNRPMTMLSELVTEDVRPEAPVWTEVKLVVRMRRPVLSLGDSALEF